MARDLMPLPRRSEERKSLDPCISDPFRFSERRLRSL